MVVALVRFGLLKSLVDGYKDEVQNDETSLGRKQYGYEPDALTKLENDYVEDKKKIRYNFRMVGERTSVLENSYR